MRFSGRGEAKPARRDRKDRMQEAEEQEGAPRGARLGLWTFGFQAKHRRSIRPRIMPIVPSFRSTTTDSTDGHGSGHSSGDFRAICGSGFCFVKSKIQGTSELNGGHGSGRWQSRSSAVEGAWLRAKPFGLSTHGWRLQLPPPATDRSLNSQLSTLNCMIPAQSGSRVGLPSRRRRRPRGLAFFNSAGSRASGMFW